MGALADMILEVFAMESTLLRAEKMESSTGRGWEIAVAMAKLYAAKGMDVVELAAAEVIAAGAEEDILRTQTEIRGGW